MPSDEVHRDMIRMFEAGHFDMARIVPWFEDIVSEST